VAFLLAAAALMWSLLRRLELGPAAASLAVAAALVSDGILRESIGGMECTLFLALLFATCLAILAARDPLAVWLASLASLTRPEGLLLLPVAFAAWLLHRGKKSGSIAVLAGLMPLALWTIFATIFFGTPVPHSVLAKARPLYPQPAGEALRVAADAMGAWSADGPLLLWQRLDRGSFDRMLEADLLPTLHATIVVLLGVWAIVMWWTAIPGRNTVRKLALPLTLGLLVAFYAAANPQMMSWYYPALQATWLVFVLAPALAPGTAPATGRLLRGGVASILIGSAFLVAARRENKPDTSLVRQGSVLPDRARMMAAYVRAASWVGRNSDPGARVAAAEIGVLGYLLDRRILDACGLVTHEALPFIPASPEERGEETIVIPVAFVKATHPDFVVSLAAFVDPSLLRSPWFLSAYALADEEATGVEGTRFRSVLVYRLRKPAVP
jgi:hypothetical protein